MSKERIIFVHSYHMDLKVAGYNAYRPDSEVAVFVYKSSRTWERRTAGKRYVNARGTTPCWRTPADSRSFDTRYEAAEAGLHRVQK
jgi:hypothetical protein